MHLEHTTTCHGLGTDHLTWKGGGGRFANNGSCLKSSQNSWISLFYLFSGLSPGFDRLFSSVVVVFGELTSQGFSDVSSLFSNRHWLAHVMSLVFLLFSNSKGFACFSRYLKYGENVLNSCGKSRSLNYE
jgi:hypothetical protein